MPRKTVSPHAKDLTAVKALVAWAESIGQQITSVQIGGVAFTMVPKPGAIRSISVEDNSSIIEQFGGAVLERYLNSEPGDAE